MNSKPTCEEPRTGADTKTIDDLTFAALGVMLMAFGLGFVLPERLFVAVIVCWAVVSIVLVVLILLWGKNDSPYWPYSASLTASLLALEGGNAAIMTVMMLRTFGPTIIMPFIGATVFFGIIATGTFFGIFLKRLVDLIEPAKREKWALAPHVAEKKTADVLGAAILAALATSPTLPGVPTKILPLTIAVLAIVGATLAFSDYGIHAAAPQWHNTIPAAITRIVACWLVNVAAIMLFKGLVVSPSWPYRLAGGAVAILIIGASAFKILRVLTTKKAKDGQVAESNKSGEP